MQKTTSTIVIAFLSGLVVAGGVAYVATNIHKPVSEQNTAAAAPSPIPVASQTAPNGPPPAAPLADTKPTTVEPTPAPEIKRRKPRPTVDREVAHRKDSDVPASQSSQAEVAQNAPPAPMAPEPVAPAPAPEPAKPAGNLYPPPGTQTAPPPPREPKTITLTSGTPITVRMNERISTSTNYAGDTFTANLDHPLVVDGFVIADRGSRVTGKILKADKAGRVKGLAELSLALTEIHTTDGQTIAVQTSPWDKEGPNAKKRDTAEVAGGAALGAIIGAIAGGGRGAAIGAGAGGAAGTGAVLTTRGKPAEIDSETRITFSLDNDVSITEHLNQ